MIYYDLLKYIMIMMIYYDIFLNVTLYILQYITKYYAVPLLINIVYQNITRYTRVYHDIELYTMIFMV